MGVFREAIYGVRFDDERKEGVIERREEIVRCRDCIHLFEPSYSNFSCECWRIAAWEFNVTPDGFCAWGEKEMAE